MQPPADRPNITADERGIHFVGVTDRDILVSWGEIESVDAAKCASTDGSIVLEVYVNHFSGVDFRFHNVEPGYLQVMSVMEQRLIGFSRSKLEAAGTWEEKLDGTAVWQRDESVQPYEFQPQVVDPRPPTEAERLQMAAAHQASIATCAKLLGRQLQDHELACIYTGFENGRIVGNISPPLCNLIAPPQPGGVA
jgi:hypothetical protein